LMKAPNGEYAALKIQSNYGIPAFSDEMFREYKSCDHWHYQNSEISDSFKETLYSLAKTDKKKQKDSTQLNEFQNKETTDSINVFKDKRKRENIEEEEEEDFICFICMENTPSTRVEPCGHVVICKLCSDHLKQNLHFDFRTECIKCRNPIEFVVDIETDETEICIN